MSHWINPTINLGIIKAGSSKKVTFKTDDTDDHHLHHLHLNHLDHLDHLQVHQVQQFLNQDC